MVPNSDIKNGATEKDGQQQSTKAMTQPNSRYFIKLSAVAFVVAACLPFLQQSSWTESNAVPSLGVDGRAVPIERTMVLEHDAAPLSRRADSPTDVCTRFSHQSAVINGTLYIYGGQATTEPGQTENKWSKRRIVVFL